MFCSNCGNELKEGAKFCDKCGAPVSKSVIGNFGNNNSNGGQKNLIIILLAALVGLGLIAVIVFGMMKSNNKKDEVETVEEVAEETIEEEIEETTTEEETTEEKKVGWVGDCYYEADGTMAINKLIGEYFVGEDGVYVKNRWVGDYYFGSDGKVARSTVVDGKSVGADGRVIKVPQTTAPVVPQTVPSTQPQNVIVAPTTVVPTSSINTNEQFYIVDYHDQYTESFDITDDYASKATFKFPIIGGKNQEEVDVVNDCLVEAQEELIESLEGLLSEKNPPYKSFNITKAEITSISKTSLKIKFTGSLKTKTGATTSVTYRFTFNREDGDYVFEKTK